MTAAELRRGAALHLGLRSSRAPACGDAHARALIRVLPVRPAAWRIARSRLIRSQRARHDCCSLPRPDMLRDLGHRDARTNADMHRDHARTRDRRSSSRRWAAFALTTLSALAVTLPPATAVAFRTGGDADDLAGTERVRFEEPSATLYLHTNFPEGVTLAGTEAALARATRVWVRPECSLFRFAYGGTVSEHAEPGDGVNTIEWIENWTDVGFEPTAAGATDVQYEKTDGEWRIVEADVYLNGELEWSAYPDDIDQWNVAGVLAHELGHVLGLMHPCEPDGAGGAPDCDDDPEAETSLMYPFYDDAFAAPSADDLAGVCFLYPTPICGEFGCPEGQRCTESGCVATCDDETCGAGYLCTEAGCRSVECATGCDGAACTADRDCGPEESCERGSCVEEGVAPEPGCRGAGCAPSGEVCGGAGAGAGAGGACGDAPASDLPLGADCEASAECSDGRCVSGAVEVPICTRACGGEHPACPTHWACEGVSGEQVCVPAARLDGGCSIGDRACSPANEWIPLLGLVATWVRRRKRTSRSRNDHL